MIALQLLIARGTELKRWSNDFVTVKNGQFNLNGRWVSYFSNVSRH